MKTLAIIGTLLTGAGLALAQNTNNYLVNPDTVIPVGNPVGLVSSTVVTGLAGARITDITVNLDISGGYNGDLYVYLVGPDGDFNVLLNQSGSSGGSIGYLDNGFNITLDDSAADSVQNYELTTGVLAVGTPLTGTWQSAGGDLASFNGTTPDGTWTLFAANLTGGSPQSTLANWSLNIVTAPEPSTFVLMGGGIMVLITIQRRRWTK